MLIGIAVSAPAADKVTSMPNMTFNQDLYSGYVNITATKRLHYVFVESASDPTKDPLLMWFNGGPGCSSMLGFFQENGPNVVDDDTETIYPNKYSWNSNANVLYFEMPAGVGFSVGDTPFDLTHNDYTQSVDIF